MPGQISPARGFGHAAFLPFFILALAAAPGTTLAQRSGATLRGVVLDSAGAPIDGAGITFVAVNDFDPQDIEVLEVYREGTELPIEFSFAGRTRCGLVVVWLKSYAQIGAEH